MKKLPWMIVFLSILLALGGQVEAQGEPPVQNEEWCLQAGQEAACTPPHEGQSIPQAGGYPWNPPASWACSRWWGLNYPQVTAYLVANGWPQPNILNNVPGATEAAKVLYLLNNEGPFGPGDMIMVNWSGVAGGSDWTEVLANRVESEFLIPGGKLVVTFEYPFFQRSGMQNRNLLWLGSTMQEDMNRWAVSETQRLMWPWNFQYWFFSQFPDGSDSFVVSLATGNLLNVGGAGVRGLYYSPSDHLYIMAEQSVGQGIVFADPDGSRTDDLALTYYGANHADMYRYVAQRHSCIANAGEEIPPTTPTQITLLKFETEEPSNMGYWFLLLLIVVLTALVLIWRRRRNS